AYNRREGALQRFAEFKGHAIAIYYAMRDWPQNRDHDLPERVREVVTDMLRLMRKMFTSRRQGDMVENQRKVYTYFSTLSGLANTMRDYGVQTSETSRVNQYISKMIIAFDNLMIVHTYRTPITLRAYSKVFIYIFPIIYGPYFASTFDEFSANLEYVMPVLYSFILVSLDNIQDHL